VQSNDTSPEDEVLLEDEFAQMWEAVARPRSPRRVCAHRHNLLCDVCLRPALTGYLECAYCNVTAHVQCVPQQMQPVRDAMRDRRDDSCDSVGVGRGGGGGGGSGGGGGGSGDGGGDGGLNGDIGGAVPPWSCHECLHEKQVRLPSCKNARPAQLHVQRH
jgi:hypothetical protein